MKNYIQNGDVIEVPAAAAAVASGAVVAIGAHLAIANGPAAAGEPFNAKLSGVFEVPKATGAWTLGQPLYWDASAGQFTATGTPAVGDISGIATAFQAAASADAVGLVRLSGAVGTVASA